MGGERETGTANFKAFARILGERSPSYVHALKEAGRLVLTNDGRRVRIEESLALIRSTADPAKVGVVARHAAAREAGAGGGQAVVPIAPLGPDVSDAGGDEPALADYDGHSTRRGRFLADKAKWDAATAKRDYEISVGKLMDADQVAAGVGAAITSLRTRLEALPHELAPQLAPITDEAQIVAKLTEEIEYVLQELSRQFDVLAKSDAT